jgi:K(+)-stimulated pyrophosphate-energized sodium pump
VLKNVNAEIIRLAADGPSLIRKVSEMRATELMLYFGIGPANPLLAAGLLLGALAAGLFAALLLRGAGRSAARLAQEARRQWRTVPGLAELKAGARPDLAGSVRTLSGELHRQTVPPALLALGLPAAAGIVLGAAGALGFAAGVLLVGLPLALALGASGWTWEAAGRSIEGGRQGGRGSAHGQAASAGRLLGDPLRDLVAPGLEGLVRLTAAVAAVTAGLTVKLAGAGSLLERLGALVTGLVG